MNKNTALTVSGIIFGIVALLHLLRFIFRLSLIIAGVSIPLWASLVAFIISTFLSYWMWVSQRSNI